jgi:adenylyltransferase/sulfurtransferase
MTMPEMSVEELKRRLDAGDELFLLDVRNPPEWAICKLEGSTFVPLNELPMRVEELPRDREMVVLCRSGVRSQWAIGFLKQQGFTMLHNLTGGILAWADRIDPTLAKY